MLEWIQIYFYTFFGVIAIATCLSIIGIQLCARNQSGEILCLGQSSFLGILVGFGLLPFFEKGLSLDQQKLFPLIFGIFAAGLSFASLAIITNTLKHSKNTFFLILYMNLQALTLLLLSFLPHAETHLLTSVIGDVVDISNYESSFNFIAGCITFLVLILVYKDVSIQSFQYTVIGNKINRSYKELLFQAFSLITIVIAIKSYGLIFCTVLLLAPTFLISQIKQTKVWSHFVWTLVNAIIGVSFGFLISMFKPDLPTTPIIVLMVVLTGIIISQLFNLGQKIRSHSS